MGQSQWIIVALGALLGGGIVGALVGRTSMRGQFDALAQRLEKESRERFEQGTDKLRADLLRAQTALAERTAAQKKELAAATAEPRAAVQRLEQRLEMAYAELDRLRGESAPRPIARDKDGFAATQPMTARG